MLPYFLREHLVSKERGTEMDRNEEKKLETLSPFEVKNTLLNLASEDHEKMMLNAGRGNPNWISTIPRSAFFTLGQFAIEEAKHTFILKGLLAGQAQKKNILERFDAYLEKHDGEEGIALLKKAACYVKETLKTNEEDFILELTNGILGDFYPTPDRMLAICEKIVQKYIIQELSNGCPEFTGEYDLFATEGGTAAMTYIFNSLSENKLLHKGDKIAIGTPIFSPYLEIPNLNDYQFVQVHVMSSEHKKWDIPEEEIDKLKDPSIKAFFVVNPSNPPSARMSISTLKRIKNLVETERKDLIILTDDVYSTFTNGFVSLAAAIPSNTIGVYSFSKYFGCTGWRLGVIALSKENHLDEMLQNLSLEEKKELNDRYASVNLDPSSMKLIDRMVADSRTVALNHTAGLSTPQQVQMTLFALQALLDKENEYKKLAQSVVKKRYNLLYDASGIKPLIPEDDENNTFYYTEIDLLDVGKSLHGEKFIKWLTENFEPLDFLLRLAKEKSIVLMPGGGFDAPKWSLRVSLANLPEQSYKTIGIELTKMMNEYYTEYQNNNS